MFSAINIVKNKLRNKLSELTLNSLLIRNQLKIKNKNCSTYDIPDDVVNQVGKGRPKETGEASTSSSVAIIIEDPGDFQFNFEI